MKEWSDIVRQHGPLVWRTAYRLLSNDADASDCFQDTFVSAVELSRQEPIRHWPAVLKRIATARALERLRRRYRDAAREQAMPIRCDVTGDSLETLPDHQVSDPSQSSLDCEIADHLRVALTQIDPVQAEVFCLSVLEDQSYREIADQLGITVNHVGVLLHRAKQHLQDLLEMHRPSRPDPLRIERKS